MINPHHVYLRSDGLPQKWCKSDNVRESLFTAITRNDDGNEGLYPHRHCGNGHAANLALCFERPGVSDSFIYPSVASGEHHQALLREELPIIPIHCSEVLGHFAEFPRLLDVFKCNLREGERTLHDCVKGC